jgi:hypothetical protein
MGGWEREPRLFHALAQRNIQLLPFPLPPTTHRQIRRIHPLRPLQRCARTEMEALNSPPFADQAARIDPTNRYQI